MYTASTLAKIIVFKMPNRTYFIEIKIPVHEDLCERMPITASPAKARSWKHCECPSMEE